MQITRQAARAFFLANWYWITAGVLAVILFLWILGFVDSCNGKIWQKKNEELKQEIQQGKGEVKQIEEQRQNANEQIKTADNKAATSGSNFNSVLNTDSSTRESNWSKTRAKWCQDHQSDSKCRK
jgi:hypothetical protein